MKAQLDQDGKARMLGRGAKRLRDEYELWEVQLDRNETCADHVPQA